MSRYCVALDRVSTMNKRVSLLPGRMHCAKAARVTPNFPPFREGGVERVDGSGQTEGFDTLTPSIPFSFLMLIPDGSHEQEF